jgi:serine/threonine protein kinase
MKCDDQSLMRCVLTATAATDLEKRYEHRRRLWFDGPYGGSVAFDKARQCAVGLYIAYRFTDLPAFVRRARARSRLHHPHLLPVLDFGVTLDNLPYFTEPYVETQPLDLWLRTWNLRRPFPLTPLVRALTAVCQAVAYAHENGLCHLNLQPSEVQADEALKDVFVFGGWEEAALAPPADPERQLVRSAYTPAYAAPEQVLLSRHELLQRGTGPLVDVYGLGGILYEVLYGAAPNQVPPGVDLSLINLVQALLSGRAVRHPDQPRIGVSLGATMVRSLERIIFKALDREPRERYGAVPEMVEELERWLAAAPRES